MKPLIILLSVFIIGVLIKTLLNDKKVSIPFVAKLAMSSMLIFTGIAHFIFEEGMVAMLLDSIPFKIEIIHITGLLEILGAVGLLWARTARRAGGLLILFLVCVLPANIYAALNHIDPITGASNGPGPEYLFFRIPLQVLYIAWIYWFAVARSRVVRIYTKSPVQPIGVLFIAAFLSLSFAACAQSNQEHDVSKVAMDYVDAYVHMRFEELQGYLTDSSTFQDPTLAFIAADAAKTVTGKDAILEKIRRNFNGIRNPNYTTNEVFTVGYHTIINGVFKYDQNGNAFGGPDQLFHFELKSTSIIYESNDKIIKHIDYMDYAAWTKQFENQKN